MGRLSLKDKATHDRKIINFSKYSILIKKTHSQTLSKVSPHITQGCAEKANTDIRAVLLGGGGYTPAG